MSLVTEDALKAVAFPAVPGIVVSLMAVILAELPVATADFDGLEHWPTEDRAHFLESVRGDLANVRAWADKVEAVLPS